MQGEGPGLASQLQPGLLRSAVPFGVIATVAAGDQILPGRASPARTGQNVVQGQLGTWKNPPAKLAGVAVAQQNILA